MVCWILKKVLNSWESQIFLSHMDKADRSSLNFI
jgi:hypothetical protein